MAGVIDQRVTDRYAIYNSDCMEILPGLPGGSIHFSIYSPPFATKDGGLYHYSSSDRDLSNARNYDEFFTAYEYVVRELYRLTVPGRITAVHCTDIPTGNSGRNDSLIDFPGDIIRLHERLGFRYAKRHTIWKEPLAVRNRTLAKGLAHRTIVDDSSQASVASADYLLVFRRKGDNPIPVTHPNGLTEYAGATPVPAELHRYRGWTGKQTENRFSHWIWRQYASCVWDDIRGNLGEFHRDPGVLPFQDAREDDDEKHVHPLQLDVIARALVLYTNPGERVLTPFMGVGSEVHEAVRAGRFGMGVELKSSYFKQAIRNLEQLDVRSTAPDERESTLFDLPNA